MEIFITHKSALEFWRLHRRRREKYDFRPCQKKLPDSSPTLSMLGQEGSWGLSLPLDIMVGSLSARRPSRAERPHVCSKPMPSGCFVNTDNGLYVSTPEFCFLQMASKYSLARLITLGFELCGSYSLSGKASAGNDQDASTKTMYDLPKLTSKKKLAAFVGRMKGWSGQRLATLAVQYIADGSASPMETTLAILLTLPYRYGGYGLPMPELNGRIDPEKNVKHFAGRSFYRGDLLWREAKIVLEYNSNLEHADSKRISKDAIRRSDLALCGISEITVTKEQVMSVMLLDRVAIQVSKRVKKELRYKNPSFSKARSKLRSELL